jgi:hypothetical protein
MICGESDPDVGRNLGLLLLAVAYATFGGRDDVRADRTLRIHGAGNGGLIAAYSDHVPVNATIT